MAVLTIVMLEGRPKDVKARLHQELAEVVMRVLEAKPEQVRVIIQETTRENYSVGGEMI